MFTLPKTATAPSLTKGEQRHLFEAPLDEPLYIIPTFGADDWQVHALRAGAGVDVVRAGLSEAGTDGHNFPARLAELWDADKAQAVRARLGQRNLSFRASGTDPLLPGDAALDKARTRFCVVDSTSGGEAQWITAWTGLLLIEAGSYKNGCQAYSLAAALFGYFRNWSYADGGLYLRALTRQLWQQVKVKNGANDLYIEFDVLRQRRQAQQAADPTFDVNNRTQDTKLVGSVTADPTERAERMGTRWMRNALRELQTRLPAAEWNNDARRELETNVLLCRLYGEELAGNRLMGHDDLVLLCAYFGIQVNVLYAGQRFVNLDEPESNNGRTQHVCRLLETVNAGDETAPALPIAFLPGIQHYMGVIAVNAEPPLPLIDPEPLSKKKKSPIKTLAAAAAAKAARAAAAAAKAARAAAAAAAKAKKQAPPPPAMPKPPPPPPPPPSAAALAAAASRVEDARAEHSKHTKLYRQLRNQIKKMKKAPQVARDKREKDVLAHMRLCDESRSEAEKEVTMDAVEDAEDDLKQAEKDATTMALHVRIAAAELAAAEALLACVQHEVEEADAAARAYARAVSEAKYAAAEQKRDRARREELEFSKAVKKWQAQPGEQLDAYWARVRALRAAEADDEEEGEKEEKEDEEEEEAAAAEEEEEEEGVLVTQRKLRAGKRRRKVNVLRSSSSSSEVEQHGPLPDMFELWHARTQRNAHLFSLPYATEDGEIDEVADLLRRGVGAPTRAQRAARAAREKKAKKNAPSDEEKDEQARKMDNLAFNASLLDELRRIRAPDRKELRRLLDFTALRRGWKYGVYLSKRHYVIIQCKASEECAAQYRFKNENGSIPDSGKPGKGDYRLHADHAKTVPGHTCRGHDAAPEVPWASLAIVKAHLNATFGARNLTLTAQTVRPTMTALRVRPSTLTVALKQYRLAAQGTLEDSFARLEPLLARVTQLHPMLTSLVQRDGQRRFKRLRFVMPYTLQLLTHSLRVVALDGAHMRWASGGTLLIIVAVTATGGRIGVAVCLSRLAENADDYEWLLDGINEYLQAHDAQRRPLSAFVDSALGDGDKGIGAAVRRAKLQLLPCARHIIAKRVAFLRRTGKLSGTYSLSNAVLDKAVMAADSPTVAARDKLLADLNLPLALIRDLQALTSAWWSGALPNNPRYSHVTSNSAETIFTELADERMRHTLPASAVLIIIQTLLRGYYARGAEIDAYQERQVLQRAHARDAAAHAAGPDARTPFVPPKEVAQDDTIRAEVANELAHRRLVGVAADRFDDVVRAATHYTLQRTALTTKARVVRTSNTLESYTITLITDDAMVTRARCSCGTTPLCGFPCAHLVVAQNGGFMSAVVYDALFEPRLSMRAWTESLRYGGSEADMIDGTDINALIDRDDAMSELNVMSVAPDTDNPPLPYPSQKKRGRKRAETRRKRKRNTRLKTAVMDQQNKCSNCQEYGHAAKTCQSDYVAPASTTTTTTARSADDASSGIVVDDDDDVDEYDDEYDDDTEEDDADDADEEMAEEEEDEIDEEDDADADE